MRSRRIGNKLRLTHDEVSARRPLAGGRVRGANVGDFLHRLAIPDVDLTAEVSKTGDEEETRLRLVRDEVSRGKSEVVRGVGLGVEKNGLRRHVWGEDENKGSAGERRYW